MAISGSGLDVAVGQESLSVYSGVFEKLAVVAISVGGMLMISSGWLAKRMHMKEAA